MQSIEFANLRVRVPCHQHTDRQMHFITEPTSHPTRIDPDSNLLASFSPGTSRPTALGCISRGLDPREELLVEAVHANKLCDDDEWVGNDEKWATKAAIEGIRHVVC